MSFKCLSCLVALLVAGFSVATAVNSAPGRVGCFEDNAERVWKQWNNFHEKNTVQFCKSMCKEYKFAGVQAGGQCMCADELPPKKLPDSRCNTGCSGDPSQTCGGEWSFEVFTVETMPAMVGRYLGCFQDAADRVWKTGKILLQTNSPQRCFDSCRGFRYAGTQDGSECYCGNYRPLTALPKSSCQSECNGLPGKTCGGPWTLDVYEIQETPMPVQVVGCIPLDYQPRGTIGIYKLFAQRKTWDEAWQQCEDDDAHLLIINSEEEAKFVRSLFTQVPSETRMHAGFHDLLRKGTYRTLFGEPLSSTGYTKWSKHYAQTPSPLKHCGSVDARAQLAQIDDNCSAHAVFVCEKKSESPDAVGHSVDVTFKGALAVFI